MNNAASLGSYGVGLELDAASFFTDWNRAEQFASASVNRMRQDAQAMNDTFANVDTAGIQEVGREARRAGDQFVDMAKRAGESTAQMVSTARDTYDEIAKESKLAATAIAVGVGVILAGTVVGALYAVYKVVKETTGFIVGLISGESYKNEYVTQLVKATDAAEGLSTKLGVTLSTASAINEVFAASGRSMNDFLDAEIQLRAGIANNAETYARLGIETRKANGELRSTQEILSDVENVLDDYREGWDRTAAAQALGFSSAGVVAAGLSVTGKEISEASARLEDYQLLIGPKQAAAAAEFTKATQEFTHNADLTWQGFKRAIADGAMPILTGFADFFKDGWPNVVRMFRAGVAEIATVWQGFTMGVYLLTEPILAIISSLGTSIATVSKAAWQGMSGDFLGAQKTLEEGREQIRARWSEAMDNIGARANRTWENIKMAWGQDDKGPAAAAVKIGKEFKAATTDVVAMESELDKLLKRLENNDSGVSAQFWKDLQMLNEAFASTAPERYVKLVEELIKQTKFGQAEFRKLIEAAREANREFDEMAEAEKRILDVREQTIKGIREEIEMNRLEASVMGMTNDARVVAIATRKAEAAGIDVNTEAFRRFIAELRASVQDKELARANLEFWRDAQDWSERTIGNIVRDWRGGLRQIGEDIKNYIINAFARMAAQQWVLPIVAQFTGLPVPQQLAQSGSAAGVLGSLLNGGGLLAGNSLLNGLGSLAGSAGFTGVSNFIGGATGALQGPSLTGQAVGGNAAAYGAQTAQFFSQAVPWIAAITATVSSWRRWGNDGVGRAGILGGAGAGFLLGGPIGAGIGALLGGRLFGRGKTNEDAYGIMGSAGYGTFTGQDWQDLSQRGGLFRSDKRWTEYRPMGGDQASSFSAAINDVRALVDALAGVRGVNAGDALAGFSREFKITTKDRSEADIKKDIDDFLRGVLTDQVLAVLGDTSESIRALVRDFGGTTEELTEYVGKMIGAFDFIKHFDGAKVADSFTAIGDAFRNGVDRSASQALDVLNTQIADLVNTIDTMAANEGDFVEMAGLAQQIHELTVTRYAAELALIEKLSASLNALKADAYDFALSIGQKINALGGTRDLAGLSMARATDIRNGLSARVTLSAQQAGIRDYVGAIDNWLAERTRAIQSEAAQAAAAMQTYAQSAQAANQARIDQLQDELDAIRALQDMAARARDMLRSVQLSGANPLSGFGRYALSGDFAGGIREQMLGATGAGDRAKYGNQYLDALQTRLDLLDEVYQRPSEDYLREYNAIMAEIAATAGFAESDAERAITIQSDIRALTEANNVLASMTYDAAAFAATALESVNAEARGYYEWAEQTYAANSAEMQKAYNDQLQAITGGTDVALFSAARAAEHTALLTRIANALEAAMNGGGAPVQIVVPGGGNGPIVLTPQQLQDIVNESLDRRATVFRRELARA